MKSIYGRKLFAVIALLGFFLSPACMTTENRSYGRFIPFTRDLISTYSLSEDDIKQLQFYASTEILLRRAVEKGGTNVAKGKLVVDSGKSVDEVLVPPNAPGIADAVELNVDEMDSIAVRFEESAPSIKFVARVDKPRDSFGLMFEDDARSVPFGDREYQPMNDSLHAILLVDRDMVNHLQSKRRVLSGLLLPDPTK